MSITTRLEWLDHISQSGAKAICAVLLSATVVWALVILMAIHMFWPNNTAELDHVSAGLLLTFCAGAWGFTMYDYRKRSESRTAVAIAQAAATAASDPDTAAGDATVHVNSESP